MYSFFQKCKLASLYFIDLGSIKETIKPCYYFHKSDMYAVYIDSLYEIFYDLFNCLMNNNNNNEENNPFWILRNSILLLSNRNYHKFYSCLKWRFQAIEIIMNVYLRFAILNHYRLIINNILRYLGFIFSKCQSYRNKDHS